MFVTLATSGTVRAICRPVLHTSAVKRAVNAVATAGSEPVRGGREGREGRKGRREGKGLSLIHI